MAMANDVVIRAEGLGKKYLIGHETERERYVALRDVVGRTAKGLLRSAGDMIRGRQLVAGDEVEEIWALKDVSFEIRRGEVKTHGSEGSVGRVVRLFPEQNYGFIEYPGSPDLYFTRNAVSGDAYDQLKIGAMVLVTIATGEGPMGPQASSVRPVGDMAPTS